jgi:hypothetical protein
MATNAKLLGLFVGMAALTLAIEPIPVKIYLEPQNGFESYISAAIVKKHTPVVVTRNKDEAQYMLTSAVNTREESTGGKIARCLFVYCLGMDGIQTATVQLVDIKTQEVAWAYNVRKASANAFQSTAEAIAKHLKGFLEKRALK